MVSSFDATPCSGTSHSSSRKESAPAAIQPQCHSSTPPQVDSDGLQIVRMSLQSQRLSEQAIDIVMSSWRESTKKQYKTYLARWHKFSTKRSCDPLQPTVTDVIEFLTELFQSGIGYSCLNTARSALSAVIVFPDNTPAGSHPLVVRFMKGVFERRPSLPKYKSTWDVNVVLESLRKFEHVKKLSLKELSWKLTTLLMLLSGQRIQTIHLLDIRYMTLTESSCSFSISKPVKQTRPGTHVHDLVFQAYFKDPGLCIVECLQEYVIRTKPLRGEETQLLISFVKPHKAVSKDTIGRWVKCVLANAGIDTNQFGAHSTRSASTSAAKRSGLDMTTIMRAAGWSNASTFARFYNKPIEHSPDVNFGQAVLSSV